MTLGLDPERVNKSFVLHQGRYAGRPSRLHVTLEGSAEITRVLLSGDVALVAKGTLTDLRIFASRAFSAAAASVTVIFFALFGSLFVLTQYLQLVHGYSPLSAGVRALPFALAMGAMSPVSPVLARRLGTRVIIPAGMMLMGLGLLDLSTAGVHTGRRHRTPVSAARRRTPVPGPSCTP